MIVCEFGCWWFVGVVLSFCVGVVMLVVFV